MKKLLSFMIAALTVATATAQNEDVFRLSANLEGTGPKVIACTVDLAQQSIVKTDTIVTCENRFETTMDIKEPAILVLYNMVDDQAVKMKNVNFVAVPSEHCIVEGNWDDYTFSGSTFYTDYSKKEQTLIPIEKELYTLLQECQQRVENGEDQNAVVEYFQSTSGNIQERLQNAQLDYLRANPDQDAAATILMAVEPDQFYVAYNLLSDRVKNGRMKALLDPLKANADKEILRKENEQNLAEGKPAPDFTLIDINGKPLKLSSLRGKYVILDFWGSWCGWCIKGMPQMKEYYAKYKGKLEILGVDCGDTDQKWRDAVAKHELPWKHVYHPKEGHVTELYAIQGFPTKIVIDPKGNIAKVVVGEDPAFYTYLDELFAK